jgi:hypothetical protein
MTNAKKFQEIFKKFATEVWAFPEKDFLTWLNEEYRELTTKNDLGVDCISRADAIRVASGYCHPSNVAKELAKLPSVTPQPRKGHWIVAKGSYLGMRNACCSNCKDFYTNDWNVMNYCPNCGADMREVEE